MDPPVPVTTLDYGRPAVTAADRVARVVGWAAIAVGASDALAGLFGTPFAFPGRLMAGGYGLAMLALAWGVNALCLVAGIGLVRGRPWGATWFRCFAAYAVGYAGLGIAYRGMMSYGVPTLFWWTRVATLTLLPAAHWAAFPVAGWLVLRATGIGRTTDRVQ